MLEQSAWDALRLGLACRQCRRTCLSSTLSLSRRGGPAHRKSWPRECLIPSVTSWELTLNPFYFNLVLNHHHPSSYQVPLILLLKYRPDPSLLLIPWATFLVQVTVTSLPVQQLHLSTSPHIPPPHPSSMHPCPHCSPGNFHWLIDSPTETLQCHHITFGGRGNKVQNVFDWWLFW